MSFTRRLFLKLALGIPILSCFPVRLDEVRAELQPYGTRPRDIPIGEFFEGEELIYEIGFWLIRRGAIGRLSFKETDKKGYYLATLQTETLGILGWVARYRVDTYRSLMEQIDGGKSLRAVSFEEHVKIGSKIRRRIHQFDYKRMRWRIKRLRKDGTWEEQEEPIPSGKVYDDFITASYNFRYGVYGSIEPGKKYVIPTFPRKGVSTYEVDIASEGETLMRRRAEKIGNNKDILVRLKVAPEITYSKDGIIEGWLTRDLYPVEGAIKDVILVGDVKGMLISCKRGRGYAATNAGRRT